MGDSMLAVFGQSRATVRHWDAESKKQHEETGFHPGWSQVAEQLEAVAVRLQ